MNCLKRIFCPGEQEKLYFHEIRPCLRIFKKIRILPIRSGRFVDWLLNMLLPGLKG